MRSPAAALLALGLVIASSSVAAAQDSVARDGGPRDAGAVDAGARDAGIEAGLGAAPSDEQPALDAEPAPLPEGHEPEVELTIEPREGLVTGDLVRVLITVRLPEGDDVAVPRQTFGPFELHGQRHRDRPIDGGRREYTFEIELLALEPGEHELPALRLRVVTADGDVGGVRTEPQRIVIGSLIANEPDAQPRPPTEPLAVMQDDYTLAWVFGILGAILLTALLTWLLARWWSRRPKKAAPPPPPRPAWETALGKLTALHRQRARLIEEGKHVELVDGVSDALREYFGARFDFNGLESTTDEVISRLSKVRLQGTALQEIQALLGDCDLVKFAKAVPNEDECERMIGGAVKIVRATMPSAAPAITPAAQPAGTAARNARQPAQVSAQRPAQGAAVPSGASDVPAVSPESRSEPSDVPAVSPESRSEPSDVPAVSPESRSEPSDVPSMAPRPVPEPSDVPATRSMPVVLPVTRESPLMTESMVPAATVSAPARTVGQPIVLPLALSSAASIDAVISATVLGVVEARSADRDHDGTIIVTIGAALPDEYASRQALRAAQEKLQAALHDRRTAAGAPLRVVIEHLHETAREASEHGREPRKTVYATAGDRPTPTGNAFAADRSGDGSEGER